VELTDVEHEFGQNVDDVECCQFITARLHTHTHTHTHTHKMPH